MVILFLLNIPNGRTYKESNSIDLGFVVCAYIPSTWEAEVSKSQLSLRPTLSDLRSEFTASLD